ncbi:MAG: esterase/lipase family protein [Candidatus Hodarchaeota archaeon]
MKEIHWQILNIYDEGNLVDGILQSLPAYLNVKFNIKTDYKIKVYSPEGVISGKKEGVSYHGFTDNWRIPLLEQPGEWKLGIYLYDENQSIHNKTVIEIVIPSNLFEDLSELGPEIESSRKEISIVCDDWLESFVTEIHETTHIENAEYGKFLPKPSESLVKETQTSIIVLGDWFQSFDEKDQEIIEKDFTTNWVKINSELKIWQYLPRELESRIPEEYSVPILLIHGFSSDYTTWNLMAQYLWEGGFRNLYGMTLYGDFYGLDKNCQHLDEVIRELLKLSQKESIYLIGHSFGGLVSRQYVKEYDNKNVRLLVTIGSPHYGIAKIFSRLLGELKKRQLEKDAIDKEKLPFPTFEAYLNNLEEKLDSIQRVFTDSDLYLSTMVNICGNKIYGGDGLFKVIEVPDMINFTVSASHLSINKSKAIYNLIESIMTGDSIVYKITLIQVNPIIKSPPDCKFYIFIKPRANLHYQRYPFQGFLEIEENHLTSQLPLIIFVHCKKEAQNERLDLQVFDCENRKIAQKELFIGLGYKREIGDLFDVELKNGYGFQFGVYSYKLHYKIEAAEKMEESGLWE